MPITLEIDPGTLIATVAISDKPDQTVDDRAVWEMDEQTLLDHPDLSSNLRSANFQYLGAVERGGTGKKPGVRTLLYTRPDVDPAAITPIEVASLGPDGAGVPDGVSGTPVDDAHADPPITSADVLRKVAQQEQDAAAQAQRERAERDKDAIAKESRDPGRDMTMLTPEEQEKLVEQARRDPTIQPGPPHTSPTAQTGGVHAPDRVDPRTGEPLPPDAPSLTPNDDAPADANAQAKAARETEEARVKARDQQTATVAAQKAAADRAAAEKKKP